MQNFLLIKMLGSSVISYFTEKQILLFALILAILYVDGRTINATMY